MKKFWIWLMCSLLMLSCSESDLENSGPLDSVTELYDLYIERDIQDLASDDAQKVAILFNGGTTLASRAAMATQQVETVSDPETCAPLLYIVNFGDNGGFALISATKNTPPVLAYSETGHFDSSMYNEPYEDLKTLVKYSIQDGGDTLRAKHALEWANYEKPEMPKVSKMSRAMNSGTNLSTEELIRNEIARKQAEGYTYIGPIASIQVHLSADQYANLISDISSHTNPGYNYEEVSLFFLKKNNWTSGPYLKTNWNQFYPFNYDAPNRIAGCTPIAVAQIVYYHKYPSKYDWDNIYVEPILNDAFIKFIKDIRTLCNPTYNENKTTASVANAKKAFELLGYSTKYGGAPTNTSLKNQLFSSPVPIFIAGNNLSGYGHSWVCDGVKWGTVDASISYISSGKTLTGTPYEDYPVYNIQSTYPDMFHMNLGEININQNVWYYSPKEVPNEGAYYSENQQTIYIWK